MSRTRKDCGTCRYDDTARLPPGSGLVIGAAIGFGSMALGIAVFLSGAGLGWALFAWLAANPLGLALTALPTGATRRPSSNACPPGRCRFRPRGRNLGRLVHV